MNILIIDDERVRREELAKSYTDHNCYYACNYDEALELLKQHIFGLISFDFNLGLSRSGYDIAVYMADNNIKIDKAIIHSHDYFGGKNIESVLKSSNSCCNIVFKPFGH